MDRAIAYLLSSLATIHSDTPVTKLIAMATLFP